MSRIPDSMHDARSAIRDSRRRPMKHRLGWLLSVSTIGIAVLAPTRTSLAGEVCEAFRITASDGVVFNSFGRAVAISGEIAVIGAKWDDDNGHDAGAAYIFRHDGRNWIQEQKLLASDGQGGVPTGDNFGDAVAIDAETVMIGALHHLHDPDSGSGSVYVFRFDPDTSQWVEIQELLAEDGVDGDGFGRSIAISGDWAVIGASGDNDNGFGSGSAYVFRLDKQTGWREQAKLTASDGAAGDSFGRAVSISGEVAVVGASGHSDNGSDSGSAYVFRYDPQSQRWMEEQELQASDAAVNDDFARAVSISGDVALIGSEDHDENGPGSGAAYVFRFDGSNWIEEQELFASGVSGADQFGRAAAVVGDIAVIGAWASNVFSGSAYVFRFVEGQGWIETMKLVPDPSPTTNFFGFSVGLSGNTAVIGAYGEDAQSGAAYIFNVNPIRGDLDCDGTVGPADLALLLGSWGPCADCPADLNGDDVVDAGDLAILLGSWG